MSTEVVMPRLSDSMEEGTITSWLKQTGDRVESGEDIVEIETDKATMSYAAEDAGVLTILVGEGETVALGAPIARIGGAVEVASAKAPELLAAAGPLPSSAVAAPAPAAPELRSAKRAPASPLARRIAASLGVDLSSLGGSGPRGRIVKADVEAAAQNGKLAPAEQALVPQPAVDAPALSAKGEVRFEDLTRLQQVVARRMAESKATAPDFALTVEVDMEEAVALRERLKGALEDGERSPSFNDMIVAAAAKALRRHPRANGSYRDGRFELHDRVNVGIAVAADDALVVPVVTDADRKGLGQIAADSRLLAEKVRSGAITPPELSGGTFTVSNLGMYGISAFTAVINVPQAAILAVGAVEPRPAVGPDGQLTVRRSMAMTLTCDHRILYGADAAEFLGQIKKTIERPERLLL